MYVPSHILNVSTHKRAHIIGVWVANLRGPWDVSEQHTDTLRAGGNCLCLVLGESKNCEMSHRAIKAVIPTYSS